MSRPLRMIDRAASAAALSYGVKRTSIGCVIAKGSRVLAVAANRSNGYPHPGNQRNSTHAERAALRLCDPTGATLYVARMMSSGVHGMAMPCPECHKAIADAGIVKVYYTDWNGNIRVDREY